MKGIVKTGGYMMTVKTNRIVETNLIVVLKVVARQCSI